MTREDAAIGDNRDFQDILYDEVTYPLYVSKTRLITSSSATRNLGTVWKRLGSHRQSIRLQHSNYGRIQIQEILRGPDRKQSSMSDRFHGC
jgi:hypothetical protein